jgi:hypothetical protein
MDIHFIGRYTLTECGLDAAIPGTLTVSFAGVTCPDCKRALIAKGTCPECGAAKALSWAAGPVKLNTIADGQLTARDVETQFHLGCDECSETLISGVHPDTVADALNRMGWRP